MPERRHGVTTLTENATKRLQAIVDAERSDKLDALEHTFTYAGTVGPATSYVASTASPCEAFGYQVHSHFQITRVHL